MQSFTRFVAFLAAAAPFVAAAPLAARDTSTDIPGKYLIQLKPDTDVASIAAHHNKVREIHARNLARRDVESDSTGKEREFHMGDFVGYSGSFDDATINELKALPEVLAVENDYIMTTSALSTQNSAQWGLGRISSRANGASSYIYDDTAGQGTFSYIVDTGIRTTHNDFGGRVVWGFNSVTGTSNVDNNGHGTHVAGTVGSTTYGVAKKTTLVAVKVFEGRTGSASQVISGFEWAVNDIVNKGRQNTAVINMSLGGRGSSTWDAAITAAWNKGVLAVVASGNDNDNASNYSPARSPETICVGNLRSDDARYPGQFGSNYGSAVDIFGPGTDILSTDFSSNTATSSKTGTSMASPHVAGLVSYIRGLEGASSASAVKARVLALGTPGRVTGTQGEANLIAYNGNGR